jgi:hypothetical protein
MREQRKPVAEIKGDPLAETPNANHALTHELTKQLVANPQPLTGKGFHMAHFLAHNVLAQLPRQNLHFRQLRHEDRPLSQA